MEPGAHVTSIEAIRRFRAALLRFDAGARDGLDSLAAQVRRAVEWLEFDRKQYWPAQVRRASERLVEARNALERCQLRFGSEDAPSCYEQKKAVEAAARRLQLCEDKLRATRHWIQAIRQDLNAFEGQFAKMNNCLEGDLPRAVAALERMLGALDKYAEAPAQQKKAVSTPEEGDQPADSSDQPEEGGG